MERGQRRWKPAGPSPRPGSPRSAGGPRRGGRLSPGAGLHPHLERGADPRAPDPPPASSSFAQRRLQAFILTVREEPKPPPTKRPERPHISRNQSITNTIPIQSSGESSSPPRVAFSLRRNKADSGVECSLSRGEKVYDTSICQTAETPFKRCTVVESRASSTRPPRARLPKLMTTSWVSEPGLRAAPGLSAPHAHDHHRTRAPLRSASGKIRTGESPCRPCRSENAAPQDRQ